MLASAVTMAAPSSQDFMARLAAARTPVKTPGRDATPVKTPLRTPVKTDVEEAIFNELVAAEQFNKVRPQ